MSMLLNKRANQNKAMGAWDVLVQPYLDFSNARVVTGDEEFVNSFGGRKNIFIAPGGTLRLNFTHRIVHVGIYVSSGGCLMIYTGDDSAPTQDLVQNKIIIESGGNLVGDNLGLQNRIYLQKPTDHGLLSNLDNMMSKMCRCVEIAVVDFSYITYPTENAKVAADPPKRVPLPNATTTSTPAIAEVVPEPALVQAVPIADEPPLDMRLEKEGIVAPVEPTSLDIRGAKPSAPDLPAPPKRQAVISGYVCKAPTRGKWGSERHRFMVLDINTGLFSYYRSQADADNPEGARPLGTVQLSCTAVSAHSADKIVIKHSEHSTVNLLEFKPCALNGTKLPVAPWKEAVEAAIRNCSG